MPNGKGNIKRRCQTFFIYLFILCLRRCQALIWILKGLMIYDYKYTITAVLKLEQINTIILVAWVTGGEGSLREEGGRTRKEKG